MPNALTPYASELLPVLHGRVQPPQTQQTPAAGERAEQFRAEPPRTEVRFSSRFEKRGPASPQPAEGDSGFAAQQLAQDTAALRLTARKPLVAGYGAYATTAQQTDPDRPRPGRTLDRSV